VRGRFLLRKEIFLPFERLLPFWFPGAKGILFPRPKRIHAKTANIIRKNISERIALCGYFIAKPFERRMQICTHEFAKPGTLRRGNAPMILSGLIQLL